MKNMRLQDKNVIVTGAGSGFGAGIARRFAAEGARVLIADLNADAGRAVADSIRADGGTAESAQADVAVSDDVRALAQRTKANFGSVDIVVNNAGIAQRNAPMLETTETQFDRIFAVNVKSIYLSAQQFLPIFREQESGVFLNVASTAAVRPRPGLTWYNASKGAVVTMTRSMAAELAPEGIRVNAINPVAGETPLLAEFMGGQVTEQLREKFIATIPLGRLSQPEDIANAAVFLCSDEASMITGVCLEVDGGRCI